MVPEVIIVGIDGSVVRHRDTADFPGYLVGDDGSVWSRLDFHGGTGERWRRLKPSLDRKGYAYVDLRYQRQTYRRGVFHLVLEAFVGPCPEGMEACHEDGNQRDNSLSNLRWDTRKANHADKQRHGTQPFGERNPGAKLTDAEVLSIRRLRAAGMPSREIAERFGVTAGQVNRIVKFRSRSKTHE